MAAVPRPRWRSARPATPIRRSARMPATRHASPITVGPEIPVAQIRLAETVEAPPEGPPVAQDVPEPDAGGIYPDLVEETEYGPIPRIVGDRRDARSTPMPAPPITPAIAGGKPLVAIVVTGLGLNLTGSLDAIDKLPETVTLAFAPYGKNARAHRRRRPRRRARDLPRSAARALRLSRQRSRPRHPADRPGAARQPRQAVQGDEHASAAMSA